MRSTVVGCVLRIHVFAPMILRSGFSYIAAQRKASMNLGLASPTYAVNCKDHSGQSLCSPVNADALLIVRVSTRGNGLLLGTGATCCRVSIKACSVFIDRAVSASMSAVT